MIDGGGSTHGKELEYGNGEVSCQRFPCRRRRSRPNYRHLLPCFSPLLVCQMQTSSFIHCPPSRKIVPSVVAPSQLPPFPALSDGDSVRARPRRFAIHHQLIGKLPPWFLATPAPGRACGPLINCTLKPCDRRSGGWWRRGGEKGTTSSFLPLSLFEWQLSEVKRAFAESGASVLLEVLSRPLFPVVSPSSPPSFLKQTQRAVEEDGREEPPEGVPRHIAGRKVHHQRSDVA